ncbi:motility associated factor glycosyltransferase family protein [Paenibacillus sp. GCM10012307]|uniref:Motility associated factor glycosyltransferase family protein n=1 Tax=Paenibacillus roseus TaxID=2798579 RepID=A0A934J432_9BACL|nr:6-hydroxymethylpterin diphosphokinase MptE-like protein [Paenibacillus roseus]MBJ6359983.1 motility associated factor glycosyltransferase family protein [Paenibacillus roseus]
MNRLVLENKVLQQNLDYVQDELRALLEPYVSGESGDPLEVAHAENGSPVARLATEGGIIHSNSLIHPEAEASRWAESVQYSDTRISLVYGSGFGYPLLEYVKRKKPYTQTLFIERDIRLFYTMLCHVDIRPLLEDGSCRFLVGSIPQIQSQLQYVMTGDFLLQSSKLTAHFTWLAHRNEKEPYLELHQWFMNTLELMIASIGNSIHDTLAGLYNTMENAEAIIKAPRLASLRGAFKGKPAIIVSNGPSLDHNIDHLRQAAGKALIITAESALRPCLERGILPDAMSVTERSPDVYHYHFANQKLPPSLALIGLTVIDPRIPTSTEGPWVPVFRRLENSARWIQHAIMESGEALKGGSSSAHLAFEFALWTGADPIIFIGQDLAFGPDKATHSRQSVYSEDRLLGQVQALQNQPAYEVPGANGGMVRTTKLWHEFKSWFEQQISLHPATRFIDATEGGAYIRGTELMTLQEAAASFCVEPLETSLHDYLLGCTPSASGEELWLDDRLQELRLRCEALRRKFLLLTERAEEDLRSCRLIDKACSLHQSYPNTEIPAYIEALIRAQSDVYHNYTDPDVSTYMQPLLFAYQKKINDLGEIDSMELLRQMNSLRSSMLQAITESCSLIARQLRQAGNRVVPRHVTSGSQME